MGMGEGEGGEKSGPLESMDGDGLWRIGPFAGPERHLSGGCVTNSSLYICMLSKRMMKFNKKYVCTMLMH